jgi:DNA invertase Pin-like site-specific DNA recombinase
MKNAYVYLRVSGKGQLDGDGFTRQLAAIRKYAVAHDIRLVKIFREEGVSGKNDLENRPALQELLVALNSNGTRLVLIEKLDRLARFLTVQESILQDFKHKGFDLVSVTEPDLCSDDPTRTLMRQVLGAFFEYERSMIVSKLRGARQRMKAKEGRCEGRKPYGHRAGEQLILTRMRELRGSGMAVDTIAATLNTEGKLARSGGLWYGATVNKILKAGNALQTA